jgi:hypothetical protein
MHLTGSSHSRMENGRSPERPQHQEKITKKKYTMHQECIHIKHRGRTRVEPDYGLAIDRPITLKVQLQAGC